MKLPWIKPAPIPNGENVPLSRDVNANVISSTLFSWVTPVLKVGYTRPLEKEDLYRLDEPRLSSTTGALLEKNFYARVPPSRQPRFIRAPNAKEKQKAAAAAKAAQGGQENKVEGEKSKAEFSEPEAASSASEGITHSLSIGSADDGSEGATLPLPVTAKKEEQADPTKNMSEKEAAKWKKKYPGNAEGGRVFVDGKAYDQSLVWALNKTFFWPFWTSAIFMVLSTVLQTTSPEVTKGLLRSITESYVYAKASLEERAALGPAPKVGTGIGYAVGLFVMQEAASLFQNQYMMRGMSMGFLMRSSLIANISRKSLRLSGAARIKHSNGQLITLVSSDASFMDWASFLCHGLWIMPMQIIIGVGLLIGNLGYSALVGVAVLVLNTPIQTFFVKTMFQSRQAQLKIVDQRVRLLQEVLNGIRVIKLYAFERFFGGRIAELRSKELDKLRTIAITRAGMSATMSFVPVLAAILTFITYSLSGHDLNAAIIFSSLQLFAVIRQPLLMLPMVIQVSSDAYVGLQRIGKALLAEELDDDLQVDPSAPSAVRAWGDFAWETSDPAEGGLGAAGGGRGGRDFAAIKAKKEKEKQEKKEAKKRKQKGLPEPSKDLELEKKDEKPPFSLNGIDIEIQKGSLVCVVGSVGSGKSSLLQALIGEMKKIRGDVVFGGSTSYVAQSAWVLSTTFRENITFNKEMDEAHFENVIHACALEADIAILPNGLDTEIGEKGVNLSGGQRARVCLARAVYFDADIILLDDPLSAVDAHVADHIVNVCLVNGPLEKKTRILVTHHLAVLPHADHIIVMDSGRITEQGTYADLLQANKGFSKLIADFGSHKEEKQDDDVKPAEREKKDRTAVKPGAKLMQDEERETGALSWDVYKHYARSMGSVAWAPILFVCYAMAQVATVGNNVFLGFWSDQSIRGFGQGDYMAIYAAFGLAAGIFTFAGTFIMYLCGIKASYALFNEALEGVMRSKVEWFDTTPLGRIVSRMSKDITTLDNQLPMQWNQLLTLVFSVLGTIGLVIYTFPWLGLIFIPMFILYFAFASFYRASSREIKRIDSVLRSFIYTNYGEMLSGMASVRAYQQQELFVRKTEHSIDLENRAYFLTIALQRWLGVRLDFLGNILVLGIGLFGVGFRETVNPSKLGVVLTYSLSVTSVFSQLVTIFATVEQDMNTAERVSHYSKLEPEGAVETDNDPPASWPEEGKIEFKDVRLRYRAGLPEVLKGVSFATRAGEKVGIVGRTGAGKSSLLQALFRIVELSGGSIIIDGRDISTIGLDSLRKSLAVIPQDALLYAGTVRENLDPTGEKDDATLNDALRRAGLVASESASEDVKTRFSKFKLDASVTDDGGNFSAGERQLVALCRALVKNSRVIVLDEATSSVDVETDASVQRAIRTEFASQSLFCIAHRLATIAFYDRILVLSEGSVAEFDTPLNLFDKEDSIFRAMCDKASLTREAIVRIRGGEDLDPEALAVTQDIEEL